MTEITSRQTTPATSGATAYDAFMSYSHSGDDRLAPRLQSSLQRFAKPWWKRRAMRVFRDESSLSANPHLWASITEALGSSDWFILLASPEAAASGWVNREVEWWLEHGDPERILPVLTDGEFGWDEGAGDLDRRLTDAAPPALYGAFSDEPRWVDLRFARTDEQLDLRNARFRDAVADLASAIRGVPKDDLESEEVRQHRGAIRTAWTGVVTLVLLLLVAVVSAVFAVAQRSAAEEQAAVATGRGLGAQAALLVDSQLDTSLLLGAEAVGATDDPGAYTGLLSALNGAQYLTAVHHGLGDDFLDSAFSSDGRLLAVPDQEGAISVWDVARGTLVAGPLVGPSSDGAPGFLLDVGFSSDGSRLAATFDAGTWVWTIPEGEVLATITDNFHVSAALSPDGRLVVASGVSSMATVWDIDAGEALADLNRGPGWNAYHDMTFSPDGSRLAFGCDSMIVIAFPSGEVLFEDDTRVDRVAWSAVGDLLAVAGPSGIRILDVDEMTVLIDGLLPEGRPLDGTAALAFNPSGDRLAVKIFSGPVTVFEITRGGGDQLASLVASLGLRREVGGPVGWQDDDRLVTADGVVAQWDLSEATTMGASTSLPGHVSDMDVAPDGSIFVATSTGIYHLSDEGVSVVTEARCSHVEVAASGTRIAASGCLGRNTIQPLIVSIDLSGDATWDRVAKDILVGTVLAHDGGSLLAVYPNTIDVHDGANGEFLSAFSFGSFDWANFRLGVKPIWLDNDSTLIVATGAGDVQLMNIETGRSESVLVADQWISDMVLHPDGLRLFISTDRGIQVVNLEDRSLQAFAAEDVGSIALSSDGATLASVGGGSIQLWDVERASRIGPPLSGSRRGTTLVAWGPQGLISAGSERVGEEVFGPVNVFEVPAESDAIGPDFNRGTLSVVVWDLDPIRLVASACRLAGRSLTDGEWAEYLPGADYDPVC